MDNQHASPVFIHSLFRAGSTYLFNVFRRSDSGYWCYQEPLSEMLIQKAAKPGGFLESVSEVELLLRHPELKKPYFYEFHVVTDAIARYFRKEFSYDQYFAREKDDFTDIKTYFSALRDGSRGRPVFQCCRTTGRIAGLKAACGGVHIFLWRNPWDQWWSYKKDHYFDSRNLLIANARHLPSFLVALKKDLKIPDLYNSTPAVKQAYCVIRYLDSRASYKLFYALWCHAMLEAQPHSELSISIDRLSVSNAYREEILEKLQLLGVAGLDFSDCSVPMAGYGENDGAFFLVIEKQVHELLSSHGYSDQQVNELVQLGAERKLSLVDTSIPGNFAVRDAMHVREYFQQAKWNLLKHKTCSLMPGHKLTRPMPGPSRPRPGPSRPRPGPVKLNDAEKGTQLRCVPFFLRFTTGLYYYSGVMPFRNLNRSLSVDSTRVVFSAMMDL